MKIKKCLICDKLLLENQKLRCTACYCNPENDKQISNIIKIKKLNNKTLWN